MNGPRPSSIYEFGDFQLDATQRLLRTKHGESVALTPRVFETLLYFVEHSGQLIDKSSLLKAVWPHVVVEEGSLSQAIYELRRALGERPHEHRYIVTLPGRGYQFVAHVVPRERPSVSTFSSQFPELTLTPHITAGTDNQWTVISQSQTAANVATDGLSRRSNQRPRSGSSRSVIRYVVGMIVLTVCALAIWSGVAMRASDHSLQPLAATPTTVATIAVLPFVDLSQQRDQQYFAEGLSEELIHLLAQTSSLRVIARTSSFSFKNQDVDVATIARKLGATHTLEGSVRRSDERVRIAVQLIEGTTTSRVWSQIYDRKLTDALAIQQEIASAVATALKTTLAEDRHKNRATTNPGAYEQFLLARFLANRRRPGDFGQAEHAYQRALNLDPTFARAWSGLAGIYYLSLDFDELGLSRDEALARMREAADTALALDPNLAEAHVRRAAHRLLTGDRNGAREQERYAAALEPTNPFILSGLASDALVEGRPADAIELQRRAVLHDPLGLAGRVNLGTLLYFGGRFDDATTELRTVLQLAGAPDVASWNNVGVPSTSAAINLAKSLVAGQRFDEALALIQPWPEGQYRDQCLALIHHALGNRREADKALGRLIASQTTEPHLVAETYAHRNDADQAFRWMASADRRSREAHEEFQFWRLDIRYSPFTRSLHGDPRWNAWLAEMDRLR